MKPPPRVPPLLIPHGRRLARGVAPCFGAAPVPSSDRPMGFHSTHGAERAAKIYTKVYNAIERNYARHWHRVVPCGFRMAGAWHEELHLVLAPHRGAFVRLPDGFPFQRRP